MKYYAGENIISQSEIPGGIEITEQEYQTALNGMLSGYLISIENGVLELKEPVRNTDTPSLPETPVEVDEIMVVSRAQGKVALIQAGLWQAVVDYVENIEDPMQKALAEVALNDTQTWNRTSAFLNQAAASLGLTSLQLDELFEAASQVHI